MKWRHWNASGGNHTTRHLQYITVCFHCVNEIVILLTNALELSRLLLQRTDEPTRLRRTHKSKRRKEGRYAEFLPQREAYRTWQSLCSANHKEFGAVVGTYVCLMGYATPTSHTTDGMVSRKLEIIGEREKRNLVVAEAYRARQKHAGFETKEWKSPQERLATLLEMVPRNCKLPEDTDKVIKARRHWCAHFTVTDAELTQTDLVVHDIDTGEHKPFRQMATRFLLTAKREFMNIIQDLVGRGIVQKS